MESSAPIDHPHDISPPPPDANTDLPEVDRGAAVVSRADIEPSNGRAVWGASRPGGAYDTSPAPAPGRMVWGDEPLPSVRNQAANEQRATQQINTANTLGPLVIDQPNTGNESANGSTTQPGTGQESDNDLAAATSKNGKPDTGLQASYQEKNVDSASDSGRPAASELTPAAEPPAVERRAKGSDAATEAAPDQPKATARDAVATVKAVNDTSGESSSDLHSEPRTDDVSPAVPATSHDSAGVEQAASIDARGVGEYPPTDHDLQGAAAEDTGTEDEADASDAVEGELLEGPADTAQTSDGSTPAEVVDLKEIEVDGQKILVPVGEGQAAVDSSREQAGDDTTGNEAGNHADQVQPEQLTNNAEELSRLQEQLAADPDNQEIRQRIEGLYEAKATLDGQPIEAELVDSEPRADSPDGAADQPQNSEGPEDPTRNPYAENRNDALENEVDKALLKLLNIEDNPSRLPELERDKAWGPKLEQVRVKLREVISNASAEHHRRTTEASDAEAAADEAAGAGTYTSGQEGRYYSEYEPFEPYIWAETLRRFRDATAGMDDIEDIFGFDKTAYDWEQRPPDPVFSEEHSATEALSPEDQTALDAYLAGYLTPEAKQAAIERFNAMSQEAKDVVLEVGRKLLVEEPVPDSQTPQDGTAGSPSNTAEAAPPPTAAERLDAVLSQVSDPETRAKFDQIRPVIDSLPENGTNKIVSAAERLLKIEQRAEEIRNSPLPRTPTAWDYVERGLPVPRDLAHGLMSPESTKVRVTKGLLGLVAEIFGSPLAALTQSMDAQVIGGNVKQGFTVKISNGTRSTTMTIRAGNSGEAENIALASSHIVSNFVRRVRAASRLN